MRKVTAARQVIGLVPAAGYARRLGSLVHSKEITPVRFATDARGHETKPKPVGQYLLETMRRAGVRKALIVIREGKWDIPEYFKDGAIVDMQIGYLLTTVPWGVPYTLDQAYPFVEGSLIALGFPDILFDADNVYDRIIDHQRTSRADVVLGLFPANRPSTMDVVDVSKRGRVRRIFSKPARTTLTQTWGAAVWAPTFTHFMHDFLARKRIPNENDPELSIGNVIDAGIVEAGLKVKAVLISSKPFLDIGLPENLQRVLK